MNFKPIADNSCKASSIVFKISSTTAGGFGTEGVMGVTASPSFLQVIVLINSKKNKAFHVFKNDLINEFWNYLHLTN